LVSLFISNAGLSTSSSECCSTPSGSGSKQVHIQSSQDSSVSSQASELQSVGYIRDEQQRNASQQIRRRVTKRYKTRTTPPQINVRDDVCNVVCSSCSNRV
jgi:hypothetical protein